MPTMNVEEKVVFSSYEINCTLYPPLFFFLFYLFLVKGMTISKEIIIHMQAYFHQFLDKQEYNFFIKKKKKPLTIVHHSSLHQIMVNVVVV